MTPEVMMRLLSGVVIVLLSALMSGCASDTVKRLTYESLQTRQQLECQKGEQECVERDSYEVYQQKRGENGHGN